MKVYLVANSTCCLVGIEQCRAFIVFDAHQAVFLQQYAGCILLAGCSFSYLSRLGGVTIYVYNKGS